MLRRAFYDYRLQMKSTLGELTTDFNKLLDLEENKKNKNSFNMGQIITGSPDPFAQHTKFSQGPPYSYMADENAHLLTGSAQQK
ncbi:unnamed protein product [Adineta steineri]|uniref:Uncharacterized protein n=1 Tax=Adineta steineri TaxID=433720 RepID=A0A813R228_9BILA|nr:unnamed protein product [Adineta steineri]